MNEQEKLDLIEEYGKDHLVDTNTYDRWGNINENNEEI
jgi:hypothetical protein